MSDSDVKFEKDREPIKVIGELIRKELNLEARSAVLAFEKWNIQPGELTYGPGAYGGGFGGAGAGAAPKPGYGPNGYDGPYGGPGLYVSLSVISSKTIGSSLYYHQRLDEGFEEVQETVLDELIQIDLISWDGSARTDRHKVIKAIFSTRAQNLMELYGIGIARMPADFQNTSALELTKILNRYTTTIRVKSITRLQKAVDYYDKFPLTEIPTPEVKVS